MRSSAVKVYLLLWFTFCYSFGPLPAVESVYSMTLLGGVHWADGAVLRLNATLPVTIVPWEFLDGSCTSKSASLLILIKLQSREEINGYIDIAIML